MTKPKAKLFEDAKAFRTALEERLKNISRTQGIALNRLRKQISFERLLVRIFSKATDSWRLKGGYAMQLRTENARATKDIDLAIKELRLAPNEDAGLELLNQLQQQIVSGPADHFTFGVTGPVMDLGNAPYGGARFNIEARLDNRTFEKFHLDIGVGDVWIDRVDQLKSSDLLSFAGIPSHVFPAISKEQQFAEKIHAYSLSRDPSVINSRVKDLIDLVLMISAGDLDKTFLPQAIQQTYRRRNTHQYSPELGSPPASWAAPYAALAADCGLPTDISNGFKVVQEFMRTL